MSEREAHRLLDERCSVCAEWQTCLAPAACRQPEPEASGWVDAGTAIFLVVVVVAFVSAACKGLA